MSIFVVFVWIIFLNAQTLYDTYKNEKNTTALMHRNFPTGFIGFKASALAR